MKIMFIAFTVILLNLIRDKSNGEKKGSLRSAKNSKINLEEYYTINYTDYPNISKESILITPWEDQIFDIFSKSVDSRYSIIIVGGWMRDKLLNHTASDMDIIIDTNTAEELFEELMSVYNYTMQIENYKGSIMKPETITNYGRMAFQIFDTDMDIEPMASKRQVIEPSVSIYYMKLDSYLVFHTDFKYNFRCIRKSHTGKCDNV